LSLDRRSHLAASQNSFGSLELGFWILSFEVAQGAELVEPLVICYLVLGTFYTQMLNHDLTTLLDLINVIVESISPAGYITCKFSVMILCKNYISQQ
jgi:hypothetical protein